MGRSASDSFLHRQQVAPGHTAAVESQPGSESQTGGFLEGGPSYPSIPKVVVGGQLPCAGVWPGVQAWRPPEDVLLGAGL